MIFSAGMAIILNFSKARLFHENFMLGLVKVKEKHLVSASASSFATLLRPEHVALFREIQFLQ